jgi:hypothetical protein
MDRTEVNPKTPNRTPVGRTPGAAEDCGGDSCDGSEDMCVKKILLFYGTITYPRLELKLHRSVLRNGRQMKLDCTWFNRQAVTNRIHH